MFLFFFFPNLFVCKRITNFVSTNIKSYARPYFQRIKTHFVATCGEVRERKCFENPYSSRITYPFPPHYFFFFFSFFFLFFFFSFPFILGAGDISCACIFVCDSDENLLMCDVALCLFAKAVHTQFKTAIDQPTEVQYIVRAAHVFFVNGSFFFLLCMFICFVFFFFAHRFCKDLKKSQLFFITKCPMEWQVSYENV